MALLAIEGFEYGRNVTDYARKYDAQSGPIQSSSGRWGGTSMRMQTAPGIEFRSRNLGNKNNAVMGCNFLIVGTTVPAAEQKLFALMDDTNEQIALYWLMTVTGQVQFRVKRGSTVIGTTTNFWLATWWTLVEWKVVLDTTGSNGSVEVKVNGISELLVTGIDTTNHGSLVWNRAYFAASTPSAGNPVGVIDDVYVLDNSGAKNNDYLGEHAIEGFLPNGNGNRNQWDTGPTPGGGNHYVSVQESDVDDDTSFLFVASQDDGKVELFAWSDATFLTDPIHGAQIEYDLRMDTGGNDHVRLKFRNGGGTEADGATKTVNTVSNYTRFIDIYEDDPTISGAWTVANWNAMQIGLESLV